MARGIGIRISTESVRVIEVENRGGHMDIVGIAAGPYDGDLETYLRDNGFDTDNTSVVCGLGPGDFLSTCLRREKEMSNDEVREQLTWEIRRKMISDPGEYTVDYVITDGICFAFAGRKNLIRGLKKGSFKKCVADVETLALYNSCELLGETNQGTTIVVSIEPEGITSLYLCEGMIHAFESYPLREEGLASVFADFDEDAMKAVTATDAARFTDYAYESINRLNLIGGELPAKLETVVLAGSGVYFGDLMGRLKTKVNTFMKATNPLKLAADDVTGMSSDLESKGAAFTTCFGLAARALEE